ncbi:hypothetical protein KY495_06310 [Massilia sp. PAMC28688]|uniref:hypothetical protein n=1 Tax=Massilia sp. PAMC28688 TaxID=2861283 RepID=UPI001C6253BC|nr:hypothetical protein [Massilia sp. PAMC28688]QYF94794.1 hypothetical protein KY495_06310 [Massilia sp. PAMC28688]
MDKHIYDKSDKGREEIATRKYHLPSKLRSLLVMMDGHRPIEELMKSFGPLGLTVEHVQELLRDEYIVLIDDGVPEEAPEAAVAHRPGMTARARQLARREMSARAHHQQLDGPETVPHTLEGVAADSMAEGERITAINEFYTQTIKSTLGLRGMMLQLKVDKCVGMDDYRELRDTYLEAVLKAKGREMALSLSGRLDQLLGIEQGERALP